MTTYRDIEPLISAADPIGAIEYLQNRGMLANEMDCPHCSQPMTWNKSSSRGKIRYSWKCNSRRCTKNTGNRLSFTTGSFFAKSKISIQKWLQIIYCWSQRMKQATTVDMTKLARKAVGKAFMKIRNTVGYYFGKNPVYLGGQDVIVECDESQFAFRVKHNRGRCPRQHVWVFGMVDTSHQPAIGWMEIVQRRDKATLLPIIRSFVRPGSIVHTDGWAAYKGIDNITGLRHRVVNHKEHFVNPVTGVHTQHIESYWSKHKLDIKAQKGMRKDKLRLYLDECAWRDRFSDDAFDNICRHISEVWQE